MHFHMHSCLKSYNAAVAGCLKPNGTPPFHQFSEKVAWKIGTEGEKLPQDKSRYSPTIRSIFFHKSPILLGLASSKILLEVLRGWNTPCLSPNIFLIQYVCGTRTQLPEFDFT